MDYVNFPIVGTLSLILVYGYLYFIYHERYMGVWIITWLIHSLRFVFFNPGIFDYTESILLFTIYQIIYVSTVVMFLWSNSIFIGRPVKIYWFYSAACILFLGNMLALLDMPFLYTMSPSSWFAGVVLTYIGISFIQNLQIKGAGNRITGYAFILWGIVTASTPFLLSLNIAQVTSLCYFVAGLCRLTIASGTLIVYFEKTRMDLANKEAQYRLFAENAVDVIYRYELLPKAKFEYVSPSILGITGYTPEEHYADAKLFVNLIHHEDLPLFDNFINNPLCLSNLSLRYRLIRKDHITIWIEQKFVPIYDKTDKLIAREGILRDITVRKNLEHSAARVDRMNMVGEMAANVAHEIRNPLTTVRGYLQMMVTKDELNNYRKQIGLMMEELDRTNTIISEYLLLAKDKRAKLKNCCLNTIIKTLSPLIQADAAASNVHVSLELIDIPKLSLDENEIRQLLLNLVRNGVEAMPSGGELTIGTGLEENKILLSVKDQGTGLPAHVLENLGTPFLTTKDTGTGLGLPICYRIANRHNAAIDVKTGDQGTTFFVSFNLPRLAS